MNIDLTYPQAQFFNSEAKATCAVAGYGCLDGNTRIYTENGLIPIKDITSSTHVLSWNESDQRFQLSLSGGSYIKGVDRLYEVQLGNAKFVSTLSHQILCADGKYRPVRSFLKDSSCCKVPQLTNSVSDQLLSSLDVQRYSKIDVDYLSRYAESARQYGLQLLKDQDTSVSGVPLLSGALRCARTSYLSEFCSKGVNRLLKRSHNRQGLSTYLLSKLHYSFRSTSLFFYEVSQTLERLLERTCLFPSCCTSDLLSGQSLSKKAYRQQIQLHDSVLGSFSSPLISTLISNDASDQLVTSDKSILQVSGVDVKPYYDLQVLGTNNYVCENGIIHHNSGKTDVAMFRLISSAIKYPTGDWLYAAPTIPLIRDIMWAKLQQFLPQIGISFTINKSESIVYLHGLGRIFCRSMDNPDRLVGFEVVDAFLDELDILPKEKALQVYRKVKARCRMKVPLSLYDLSQGYKLNQQWVTTTPEGFRATYELFKKNPAPNTNLIQMSTYSNAHNLPDDYIDDLKQNYPEQLIDAYLLGKFVNLNALGVWPSYDPDLNHMDCDIRRGEALHFGQDFNVGRGCAVAYVFRDLEPDHPQNNTNDVLKAMVAVGEVYNSFDTPDTVRALQEKFPYEIYPTRLLYADTTGNYTKSVNASISDIAIMTYNKYRLQTYGRNPLVKDRIISANAAFCNADKVRKVFLDTRKVPNYSESLIQQAYDHNGLPEKGMGKFDDMTDSGTYPIHYHFPIRANKMFTSTVRGV